MSVVGGVYEYISADSTITDQLGTYDFGDGSEPAIFTKEPANADSGNPLITITQVGGSLGSGRDRGHRGGEVTIDIKIWHDKDASLKDLRELADDVWLAMDRSVFNIDDFEMVYCLSTPPSSINDPDGFPGYVISCRILVRELDDIGS